MPKRYGRHRTWLNKMRRRYYTPEIKNFHQAMYSPYFRRAFRTMTRCVQSPDGTASLIPFVDQCEYCLDGIQEG